MFFESKDMDHGFYKVDNMRFIIQLKHAVESNCCFNCLISSYSCFSPIPLYIAICDWASENGPS